MRKRIFINLVNLSTGTFISRVLGFFRELVTAAFYGTGRAMDLFVIAFTIPTFFRHFLGEDVVERAFMPPFKRLISQNKYQAAWRIVSASLNFMTIILLVLMALLYVIAPFIVKFIAPGLEDQYFSQAVTMTYWILPFMVIIGLASFVGGILNFFEFNRIYSIAPAFMSVGVMVGIYLFKPILGLYALPAGFLIGGVLELLVQIPFLFHHKIKRNTQARYYPTMNLREDDFRKIGRESGIIFLKSMLDKTVEIVDRILASFLISGSIASLWFSQRLIQLPVAIFGLAISRSLIPYMTEIKALDKHDEFNSAVQLGIRINFLLIIPTIALMLLLGEPIITLVYQRGSFDAQSTQLTTIAFMCYATGLLGLSLNAFFSRIFSIYQQNIIPLRVSIFSAILNVVLNLILVRTPLKHGGIALASSIAFTINSVILFYFLIRKFDITLKLKAIVIDLISIGLYSISSGSILILLNRIVLKQYLNKIVNNVYMQNVVYSSIVLVLFLSMVYIQILMFGPGDLRLNALAKLRKIRMKRHRSAE
ncbi:murein biosynthesis integral membrane protein MurJ [candidate division KSB1 bacterium]|nr:murein biosynthesis integral membrane protein MurJ [candidate division KSB1 bacterium]